MPRKARTTTEAVVLEAIPNIGPALADDLRLLGIEKPAQLKGRDADRLYRALEAKTGQRQDPCVLDTFRAAVDFMNGGPARPWWTYSALRKKSGPGTS